MKSLHERALEIAKNFHNAEVDLINILQELDEKKEFLKHGYTSLLNYAVQILKLSEANAYNFIAVARKSRQIPELKMAISENKITVSNARKVTSVLTPENKNHWLDLAQNLSKHKLEKEIAKVKPETLTQEKTRYVSETRLELKLGISEEFSEKLKRAQDLLSQKTRKSSSFEETLERALELLLAKEDPIEKAKRNINKSNISEPVPGQVEKEKQENALKPKQKILKSPRIFSAQLEHQIQLRDQGQCTQIHSNGKRCENRRWLEVHHIKPLSQNGTNDLTNLKTLCFAHHRQEHRH